MSQTASRKLTGCATGDPVVKTLLQMQGVQVLFLVGERRPHMQPEKEMGADSSVWHGAFPGTIKEGDETCLGNSVLP